MMEWSKIQVGLRVRWATRGGQSSSTALHEKQGVVIWREDADDRPTPYRGFNVAPDAEDIPEQWRERFEIALAHRFVAYSGEAPSYGVLVFVKRGERWWLYGPNSKKLRPVRRKAACSS